MGKRQASVRSMDLKVLASADGVEFGHMTWILPDVELWSVHMRSAFGQKQGDTGVLT